MKKPFFPILFVLLLSACNEQELDPPSSQNFESVKDETKAATLFEESEELAFSGILQTGTTGGRVEQDGRFACAELNIEESENGNKTLTIDFGDGCVGPDNRERKGIIEVSLNGKIWEPNSVIELNYIDFSINDILIDGTRTITNKTSSLMEIVHEVELTSGSVTWPDGKFITRESLITRTWDRGEEGFEDDVLRIEGTASGTDKLERAYTMTITEPLVFNKACREQEIFIPVSGVKVIEGDNATITIDYGSGECDNTVTVNAGGADKDFEVSG